MGMSRRSAYEVWKIFEDTGRFRAIPRFMRPYMPYFEQDKLDELRLLVSESEFNRANAAFQELFMRKDAGAEEFIEVTVNEEIKDSDEESEHGPDVSVPVLPKISVPMTSPTNANVADVLLMLPMMRNPFSVSASDRFILCPPRFCASISHEQI